MRAKLILSLAVLPVVFCALFVRYTPPIHNVDDIRSECCQKPKAGDAIWDGETLSEIMDHAATGSYHHVQALVAHYSQYYPFGDEDFYWLRKGAELGYEEMERWHANFYEDKKNPNLNVYISNANTEMLRNRHLYEVMESAFSGDVESIRDLMVYYEENYPEREEGTYWKNKLESVEERDR